MATIANQIKRISDATDLLRKKGSTGSESIIGLHLTVPEGRYWDNATKTYVQQQAAPLGANDQIDKIAAAFSAIVPQLGTEIKVPITVVTDGTTTTVESYKLADGFYSNATIVPFIKVEEVDDIVINIENISNRTLTTKTGTIKPGTGFNYIGELGYTVQSGSISADSVSYNNNSVTVKVATGGWLDADSTQVVSVEQSTLKSKVGTEAETSINSGAQITPSAIADTVVTIGKGIYGSDRTITVKSVQSQTTGDAEAADILSGKVAWVNGIKVTGSMPNYGGTDSEEKYTAATSFNQYDGFLTIQPALGYYNDYSSITTTIKYNPTRIFNTTSITTTGTDTMTSQTYYETIPSGYYPTEITRKVTVQDAVGNMSIDYAEHKAKLTITKAGWVDQGDIVDVDISAGPATYKQTQADLEIASHGFTITPAKDQDGTETSYLTQVTVDNTLIFELLAAI